MSELDILQCWLGGSSETEHLEFKEAKQQYDTVKLLRYCVALANEGGGYLVLGVTDRSPRQVVGTSAFAKPGQIKSRILEALRIRVDVRELLHPDGRVLVFEVPSRPIGQPLHYEGAYLMRSGEELVPMTQDQLKRIFAEGQPDFLSGYASVPVEADAVVSLLDVQTFFDLLKMPLAATREGILARLVSERFVATETAGYRITNLGALLLAKDLREFEFLQRKAVRVVTYKGKNKLATERDLIGQKGYAVGFEGLISYVNGQLPMNEVIGQALREEARMFPELAIRELIANALVHQDFDETGGSVTIEIYADRIEITNPGQPLIPTERFVDEYKSRNERLADLMRRMGICEEKGSGIDKVVSSTEYYQLPAPHVRVSPLHTTVALYAHKEFADMEPVERVRACYLHCCLRYVSNEKMTNQSLRERFKLEDTRAKSASVSQIIAATVMQGLVKLDDPENTSKRYAKYVPFWA
ncbi:MULTISPECIES: ATP-binding protein [unclassified Pseudomonas]|uniref:ATP-binding protein n=1 Tax=unclassified Pseudomonas TaxID=196821 RepID=UPI0023D8BE59|nr:MULTISPECIES: ATP-binding protein [unclassified Pseudomonas]MED5606500.1 ATP-binding protein [Pseudomonas sp. JH-2]